MIPTQHYTCEMCGAIFLLNSRFQAHKENEIPAFVAMNAEKQLAYETRREQYLRANGIWLERSKTNKVMGNS